MQRHSNFTIVHGNDSTAGVWALCMQDPKNAQHSENILVHKPSKALSSFAFFCLPLVSFGSTSPSSVGFIFRSFFLLVFLLFRNSFSSWFSFFSEKNVYLVEHEWFLARQPPVRILVLLCSTCWYGPLV